LTFRCSVKLKKCSLKSLMIDLAGMVMIRVFPASGIGAFSKNRQVGAI